MNDSYTHASGFEPGETRQLPMRISAILDQLTIERDIKNFVPILFTVIRSVSREHPYLGMWQQTDVVIQVLTYVKELEPLRNIFESSATHAIQQLQKRERACQCLLT